MEKMTIKCNLDRVQYAEKPTQEEVQNHLRKRLCNAQSIVEIEPERLFEAIERGQSFTPAVMTGTKGDTWKSQQIIVADIDNDGKDILNMNDAYDICNSYGIDPYLYKSFSYTEDRPKFRVVIILSEPITDPTESQDITKRLIEIFNDHCEQCADTKISDNARLIFGSRKGSVIHDGKITSLDTVRKLPRKHTQTASHDESITALAQSVADGIQGTQNTYDSDGDFDILDMLDFLKTTDCVDDYEMWLNVGKALKYDGQPLAIWENWSRASLKYKEGECEVKWRSFHETTSNPVTVRTITKYAKDRGYFKQKRNQSTTTATARKAVTSAPPDLTTEPEVIPPPNDHDAPPITTKSATKEAPTMTTESPEPTPQQCLDEFYNEIKSTRFKPIETGIDQLDKALQGGFERRTLVTLSGAPGISKTAIAQYILEKMAYDGHPVVYVNLEMDRSQLLSRSIARISHQMKLNKTISDDITALQVKRGYKWTEEQQKVVEWSTKYYRDHIAPNFYYVTTNPENIGSIDNTLSDILRKLEKITAETVASGKEAPIVCIDYLQFIDYDMYEDGQRRPETADAIKATLKHFKQFAMSHDTCVIMIMAQNRASNAEGRASIDSGRDTSNIEYSGDVMMSLVYTATEEKWKYSTGTDAKGNDKPALINNDFITDKIDYTLQLKNEYPLIAKLLSLKVVKGRSIMSRGVAKFIYDGRYFYFENDNGTKNPYWSE